MKVKIPLALMLLIATVLGYALGTENGRAQRDAVLVKLGRKDAIDSGEATADDSAAPESA
jgi:hypothetical protein